jgi:glucose/arabinose dehydrogenase
MPIQKHAPNGRSGRGLLLAAVCLLAAGMALAFLAPADAYRAQVAARPPRIDLAPVATVEFSPVDIAFTGLPGDDRIFVVEQDGTIRIIAGDGAVLATPFLDIEAQVLGGGEQGLLGLVFDPDYAANGYFYVNYTHLTSAQQRLSRISRFAVTADPNIADPASELIIFTVEQPFSNHNGGDLNFGPDGYLYIGFGDGGSAGDPGNRAQDLTTPLGKVLRIDVSGTSSTTNYLIPPDNPFVGDPAALGEIWHLGLRNPLRFRFDALTGDLYIGDVGQYLHEEIDFQPAGSTGGENWGWRCYEGFMPYDPTGCGPFEAYDPPILAYSHAAPGCAVTGGYVYRGDDFPALQGFYLFGDYCFGQIWALDPAAGWQVSGVGHFAPFQLTTFGQDPSGELYAASAYDNTIYRVVAAELPWATYLPAAPRDALS